MATTYKAFNAATDVISTRTLLHEGNPINWSTLFLELIQYHQIQRRILKIILMVCFNLFLIILI